MSPNLGHFGRGRLGLWAALLAAAPTPAWAEAVSIAMGADTGRVVVLSALAAGGAALATAASLWALAEQRNENKKLVDDFLAAAIGEGA